MNIEKVDRNKYILETLPVLDSKQRLNRIADFKTSVTCFEQDGVGAFEGMFVLINFKMDSQLFCQHLVIL